MKSAVFVLMMFLAWPTMASIPPSVFSYDHDKLESEMQQIDELEIVVLENPGITYTEMAVLHPRLTIGIESKTDPRIFLDEGCPNVIRYGAAIVFFLFIAGCLMVMLTD